MPLANVQHWLKLLHFPSYINYLTNPYLYPFHHTSFAMKANNSISVSQGMTELLDFKKKKLKHKISLGKVNRTDVALKPN